MATTARYPVERGLAEVEIETEPLNEVEDSTEASDRTATTPEIDYEEVARLAYCYWLDRQGRDGSAEEDWLRAEQDLRSRPAAQTESEG
jgi:hypothetical protein